MCVISFSVMIFLCVLQMLTYVMILCFLLLFFLLICKCKVACIALWYKKLHHEEISYSRTWSVFNGITQCYLSPIVPYTLSARKSRATLDNLHPQCSAAVTHYLLVVLHLTDLKKMVACVELDSVASGIWTRAAYVKDEFVTTQPPALCLASRWPSWSTWISFTLPAVGTNWPSCIDVPLNTRQTNKPPLNCTSISENRQQMSPVSGSSCHLCSSDGTIYNHVLCLWV